MIRNSSLFMTLLIASLASTSAIAQDGDTGLGPQLAGAIADDAGKLDAVRELDADDGPPGLGGSGMDGGLSDAAPASEGALESQAVAGLENLGGQADGADLDVYDDWVCADEGGGPWDTLEAPAHDTLRWCMQTTDGGWAIAATDDDRHWCVSSDSPAYVGEVDVLDDCAPPDEDW